MCYLELVRYNLPATAKSLLFVGNNFRDFSELTYI
jgi:hypothetical protein